MAAPSTGGRKPLLFGLVPIVLLIVGALAWRFVPANAETPEPVADYWEGEYFAFYPPQGMDPRLGTTPQTRPVLFRNDAEINFDWGRESPGQGVPADQFSVRWSRAVRFSEGTYRFHVKSDDGVRLYVDDVLKIDRWFDNRGLEHTADVKLSGGSHKLRVEYYENWGNALIKVGWEPIPESIATLTAPGVSSTNAVAPPTATAVSVKQVVKSPPPPPAQPIIQSNSTTTSPTGDLLVNGGFEQDNNGDGLPDGWAVSIPDGEFVLATGLANTPEGKKVAVFQPSMKTFTVTQEVKASQHQDYEFSGHVSIPSASGWFRLSLTLIPMNDQGQPLASYEIANYTKSTPEWEEVRNKINTPSYTSKLRVQIKVDIMRATAYLDDFQLKSPSQ